jgi:predicted Rossmann fold nucleotide-binding protein DprA/Smf involved in DNA uptake
MDPFELKYWVAFNRVSRVGRARMALLEGHFGALSRAWKADAMELNGAGLDQSTARHIVTRRATIDPDRELENVISAGIKPITWHDDDYPNETGRDIR